MFLTTLSRQGTRISIDASSGTLDKYGVITGTWCQTPLGLGFVVGEGENSIGNTQLWFALEKDRWRISYWDSINDQTSLNSQIKLDSELAPLTLEQFPEWLISYKVNHVKSQTSAARTQISAISRNERKLLNFSHLVRKAPMLKTLLIDASLHPSHLPYLSQKIKSPLELVNNKLILINSTQTTVEESLQEESVISSQNDQSAFELDQSSRNKVEVAPQKKLNTIDPKVIFSNFRIVSNILKQNKNLFKSILAKKLSHQNQALFFWNRAIECLNAGQFDDGIFCCTQGYQASYVPINLAKLESDLSKLSKTYLANSSYLYIEFARLEACIIEYLILDGWYDKLFQIAQDGNELALNFFILDKDTPQYATKTAIVLNYISNKIRLNDNSEIATILHLGLEFKNNFENKFEEAVLYLDNICTPRLKLFLRATMVHFISVNNLNDEKYLKFVQTFLIDINNSPDVHYLYPRILSKLQNYTQLALNKEEQGGEQKNEEERKYECKKQFLQLGILKGDVYCNSDTSSLNTYLKDIESMEQSFFNMTSSFNHETVPPFSSSTFFKAFNDVQTKANTQLKTGLSQIHNYKNEGINLMMPLLEAAYQSINIDIEENNDDSDEDQILSNFTG